VERFAERLMGAKTQGCRTLRTVFVMLLVSLLMTSGLAYAVKSRPVARTSATLVVQRGEIEIEGPILSIDEKARLLVLEARKITSPGGKSTEIAPPRNKTVTIGSLTLMSIGGGVASKLDLADLRPDDVVCVIGKDLGVGKPLPARLVIVKAKVEAYRSPAGQHIEITSSALRHIMDRHTVDGTKNAGTSIFNAEVDIRALIKSAETVTPVLETNGRLKRVIDAGRIVGTYPDTGKQTSKYRVITTQSGKLVTAYPAMD
jgi:hypothetical protein